ncbi:hypothetical protein [Parasedimentitalea huanghaiensis]|nr:hypothetical protein [Zongyanglinia huanghaiensis]
MLLLPRVMQALAVFLLSAPIVWAAEFTLTPNDQQGCTFKMSGMVKTGDLDALKLFARTQLSKLKLTPIGLVDSPSGQKRPRLCLSSSGGSLAEAVRIAEFLRGPEDVIERDAILPLRNLATVVAAGDTCESACAILFMAGQVSEGQHGRFPDRYLHKDGRLGFHAPSLSVADGVYDKGTVDKAFKIAVAAIGLLMRNASDWGIHPTLLTQMLLTEPEDMAYLQGTAALQEYNIKPLNIDSARMPTTLTRGHVRHLCYLALNGAQLVRDDQSPGVASLWEGFPKYDETFRSFKRGPNEFDDDVIKFEFGVFDEGGFGCTGEVSAESEFWGSLQIASYGAGSSGELVVKHWMLLLEAPKPDAFGERLCALTEGQHSTPRTCQVTFSRTRKLDFSERLQWIIDVPEGQFEVASIDGNLTLNGRPAEPMFDSPGAFAVLSSACIKSDIATFCMAD